MLAFTIIPGMLPGMAENLKILFVEDNASLVRLVPELLRQDGHTTTTATDKKAALAAIQESEKPDSGFDLVLLDGNIPPDNEAVGTVFAAGEIFDAIKKADRIRGGGRSTVIFGFSADSLLVDHGLPVDLDTFKEYGLVADGINQFFPTKINRVDQ